MTKQQIRDALDAALADHIGLLFKTMVTSLIDGSTSLDPFARGLDLAIKARTAADRVLDKLGIE